MTKLKKLLFAAALTGAAFAFQPSQAEAWDPCRRCATTGECFPCCECDGYTLYYCAEFVCP